MIYVSKTYEVVTEESAENGDAADRGFVYEDVAMTFGELVDEMQEYEDTGSDWLTHYGTQDDWFGHMEHGEPGDYVNYSLHYSHKNPSRNKKHWDKAIRLSRQQ